MTHKTVPAVPASQSEATQPAWTPGPWIWTGRYVDSLDGMTIALVYTDTTATFDRNGVLLAAAPELAAALRALLVWGLEHTSPRDANSPHDLLVQASVLLARIGG